MSNEDMENVRVELYMAINGHAPMSELKEDDLEEVEAGIVHDLLLDEMIRDILLKLSIKLKDKGDTFDPDIVIGIRLSTDEGTLTDYHETFEP